MTGVPSVASDRPDSQAKSGHLAYRDAMESEGTTSGVSAILTRKSPESAWAWYRFALTERDRYE